MASQACTVAATGLSQRWLVDTALGDDVTGVLAAVAVGALAFGLATAGGRIQSIMLLYLIDRVQVALSQEIHHFSAAIPTVDHLERPDYLDRLERLRSATWALASSCWQIASAVAATVSLAATAVLLGGVYPALCLLTAFALPSVLTTRRSAWIVQNALDADAQLNRCEQRLHDLCLSAEAGKELSVSGAAAELDRRADAAWHSVTTQRVRARCRAGGWDLLGWCCFAAGFCGALLLVGWRVAAGQATVGEAVLVISLATQLQAQFGQVVREIGQVAAAGHVIDHYAWLRAYTVGHRRTGGSPPGRLAHGIRFSGVSFRYPGAERDVIKDLDLWLPVGMKVAVVGENGAGKTTLVKLLSGLYEVTRGSILVDGQQLRDLDPAAWRARISAVYQDFARYQFRLRECVGVGDLSRLHDEKAVAAALDRAGARDLRTEWPRGLEAQLGPVFGGIEPSIGQWQKLALARGLMRREPLITILDEPTASLDPQAEHDLFVGFAADQTAVSTGRITVFVSHRFSTVRMADLIVVLSDGRIAELGSHRQLMALKGLYADMYGVQADVYIDGLRAASGADRSGNGRRLRTPDRLSHDE
ncbi:ABC transporter ATP-binding protein/permease [Kribbella sp. NBC_01505]|uniref:ABC transporter ATP-binding protein n=1 Tax=Kribbella sp. NBC_01505 TaxID=2903580 RepID=UPI00386714B6